MTDWRVDPDRVVGVLAAVDERGLSLEGAAKQMDGLSWERSTALSVDGRTTLTHAWERLTETRRLVPGKLMHAMAAAAAAVTEATTAVVAGDETMAATSRDAEAYALSEWGIDASWMYTAP